MRKYSPPSWNSRQFPKPPRLGNSLLVLLGCVSGRILAQPKSIRMGIDQLVQINLLALLFVTSCQKSIRALCKDRAHFQGNDILCVCSSDVCSFVSVIQISPDFWVNSWNHGQVLQVPGPGLFLKFLWELVGSQFVRPALVYKFGKLTWHICVGMLFGI